MPTLSAVINTLNVESTLSQCLDSLAFVDELIVVDMASEDATVSIAQTYGAKIFSHEPVHFVEPARNFAISKASSDWVLIVDADEEIPPTLAQKIHSLIQDDNAADCYYLPRKNEVFGKFLEYTGWWPDYVLRLFKKGSVDWPEVIHAVPITRGTVSELPPKTKFAIVHHNYQTVEQFLSRMNRYSSIQAKTEHSPKSAFSAFSEEWLRRFFAEEGYREGTHGSYLSLLQALSEVATQAKMWQETGFTSEHNSDSSFGELRQFQKDLNYWLADAQLKKSSGIVKLWWQFRRKFKI